MKALRPNPVHTGLEEKMVVFCRVAIRHNACSSLHDGALQCTGCVNYSDKVAMGVVSLLFHLPTFGAQRLAQWLWRIEESGCHCS